MRFLRRLFRRPKVEALAEVIAALSRSEAALTDRIEKLNEYHVDLTRQIGIMQAATQKKINDLYEQNANLRTIVTQLGEQAKQHPTVARNMADIRRFTGELDAD